MSPRQRISSSRRSVSPSRRAHVVSSNRRSRSPSRRHDESRAHKSHGQRKVLPFQARELTKHDLKPYRDMFALYLDVQKSIDITVLEESEVKGRWKSFVRKWNEKDLAEGWYDPATKQKADQQAAREPLPARFVNSFEQQPQESEELANDGSIQADDYEVGPAAPSYAGSMSRSGPSAPNRQDLQYRDEIMMENRLAMRDEIRNERKLERRQEKERMEELVPRADAGTRERQLEKKQDINAARASYREANESGDQEVPESELLGDDGFDSYKRKKNEEEKKKTERQIRKEEIWRAKAEERREKLDEMRMKEDKTLEMLKALAKQRYG